MDSILTVDGVLVGGRRVLLIERTKAPYMDKLVFPGGHVEEGESLEAAVVRELAEEVGVEVSAQDLTYLIELSDPGRDPRPGHRVAHVYWMRVEEAVLESAVAGSDACALYLVDIDSIEPDHMGFDHYRAIVALKEVLSWRDVETKLPVLAPFSILSDRFRLMVDEWGRGRSSPSLPTSLVHTYDDVYKLLNNRRKNRQVEVECKATFQGLLPDDVRRVVTGVQEHFRDIRVVLAEVDHWQIEEHERPALSDDPLVIGWDGSDFYLLAAFDLTPAEAAVERICLGTTPSA